MAKRSFHTELLESDEFARCTLRATFFVHRLRASRLYEVIQDVHNLTRLPGSFPWSDRKKWGIEQDAWQYVTEKQKIDPLLVFCHPRVVEEQPRLVLYYRTAALIPQKQWGNIVPGNIKRIENGQVDELESEWISQAVVTLNSVISAVIKNSVLVEAIRIPSFQFATLGTQIQGSWNNAIGDEGERAVKSILVNHLRGEILQIVWRNGRSEEYIKENHDSLLDRVGEVRILRLKHGFHLKFSNEPDISLRDSDNAPHIAIEVKAGFDAPGALERLGAGMKSFENDRDLNPRVKTVYIVRCMTPELQARINQGHFFDHTFSMSELLVGEKTQKALASLLLRVILKRK